MKVIALAALAAALAAPSALAAGNTLNGTVLNGTVGPGFTISLTQGGKHVSKLKAGQYTIVVNDKATIHDFHLSGPGVDKKTSVGGQGTTTWKVTLEKGSYHFQCDPHASIMNGSFAVT
ncbi:MAG TPA: plastocyanin/azurin family copper-binding protein [Gaiellaceae bacterium]|jgi:plastocyanin|nr:plastocyanin/azurin family copper-binding protein [Gaiellaceae bacterium]